MAASSETNPVPTTASRCTLQTASGRHLFEIDGYALLKGLGTYKYVRSAAFSVGGYDWCVRFYPEGHDEGELDDGYAALYLELLTKNAEVRANFTFSLVDGPSIGATHTDRTRQVFNSETPALGTQTFVKRSELEASPYLKDDRLVISCNVLVILGTKVSDSEAVCDVQVPPSDLSSHLGKLLEHGEGADVAFEVKDEVFRAHKIVLAMRSPFFKAKLYGTMSHQTTQSITVEDMEPAVFKALLHFIYTDSLPAMLDEHNGDEYKEMVRHLVVAADMYGMERMKVVCEGILCKTLDVGSVATTLALADQHSCNALKDACIGFIHSSNSRTDDVMASQGYNDIKRSWNAVFVDMWEKSVKHRKIL